MEFWTDDALTPGIDHRLACTLSQREECRLSIASGVPKVRIGPLCGLRLIVPGLQPRNGDEQLWLDTSGSSAWYAGRRACLSAEEFIVLALLASARGDLVTHAEVADCVWGESPPDRSADLIQRLLRQIRLKFRAAGLPDLILQTERGIGLRLKEGVAV